MERDRHSSMLGKNHGLDWASSHKFLLNVKGFEISDWKNLSPSHHSEYNATKIPVYYNYKYHFGSIGEYTMFSIYVSVAIVICHPASHKGGYNSNGTVSSQWLNYPSNYVTTYSEKYANFSNSSLTYTTQVPVTKTNWLITSIFSTIPLEQSAATYLFYYYSYTEPYPNMLKWDYTKRQTGESSPQEWGCLICHTSK